MLSFSPLSLSRKGLSVLSEAGVKAAQQSYARCVSRSRSTRSVGISAPSSCRLLSSSSTVNISASATLLLRKSLRIGRSDEGGPLSNAGLKTSFAGTATEDAWDAVQTTLANASNLMPGMRLGQVSIAEAEERFANRIGYGLMAPCTPTTGRSVAVTRDSDVAGAYRELSAILRRNNVRDELKRGERYEKPNQLRRRKISERHRRRFADMVRQKVQLVMAIRARGE